MPTRESDCIRLAALDDAQGIARLSAQLGYPAEPVQVERHLSRLLPDPDHVIFVAESQGGSLSFSGWAHVFLSRRLFMEPFAELGGIVVDETFRRLGIGAALLTRAEAWAAGEACTLFRIRSNALRTASHAFYERMGYTASKSQRIYDKKLFG